MAKIATDRILKAVDMRELISHYGGKPTGRGEIRSSCVCHGGDNPTAMVSNEKDKLFYCHTQGCSGDAFDLVMKAEDCTFKEAAYKLAELFEVSVDWSNETIEERPHSEEARKFIERMMRKQDKKELPTFKMPRMKLAKVSSYRGYSPETISHWKFFLAKDGELQDRIIIPFEDVDNRLVGITGRATKADQPEKFMHRPRNLHTGFFLTGLGRNKKFLEEYGYTVKIVEGVFDCARWYDSGHKNVCAPIGVFFTEEHIEQLYKAGVIGIDLGFDNDPAGRNGIRRAIKRAKYKFDINVLVYPEGKDADDCTKEELDEVDKNKLPYKEWLKQFGEEQE